MGEASTGQGKSKQSYALECLCESVLRLPNKRPQTGWLQQTFVFSQFWQLEVQIRVPAGLVSGEDSSWLADGSLHTVPSHGFASARTWGERGKATGSLPLFYKETSPARLGSHSMTSFIFYFTFF